MSLLFTGAASNKINCGSDTSLDNLTTATYMTWSYFTTTPTSCDWTRKGLFSTGASGLFYVAGTPDAVDANIRRATVNLDAKADVANFSPNMSTQNSWLFAAGVHDSGGADGDQKLFGGDLNTLATEPSAYSVQTVGSGARGDNSGTDLIIGNRSNDGLEFDGRIGFLAVWNRVLTLGEIHTQQFRPHVTSGCILFIYLGFNGTGTQPDYSGNGNNGTVTGATVADHVPLTSPFGISIPWVPSAVVAGVGQAFVLPPYRPIIS